LLPGRDADPSTASSAEV